MKKWLALLLALILIFSLAACGNGDGGETSGTSDVVSENQSSSVEVSSEQSGTSSTESVVSQTSSAVSTTSSAVTSSQPVVKGPDKVNPKTTFKYGKYQAKYFNSNKTSYHVSTLIFYEDFEGVEYCRDNYYTKEVCESKYEDWGSTFNPADFGDAEKIVLNGVTYYNIGDYDHTSDAYKMTETNVKVTSDFESWAMFSYYSDGTLVLDSTVSGDRYALPKTVFTFVNE